MDEDTKRRLVHAATASFARRSLLARLQNHQQAPGDLSRLRASLDWRPNEVAHWLRVLPGRCDLVLKANESRDPSVTAHAGLLAEAARCRVGGGAEYSRSSYGERGCIVERAAGITSEFVGCSKEYTRLNKLASELKLFEKPGAENNPPSDADQCISNLRKSLKVDTSDVPSDTRRDFLLDLLRVFKKSGAAQKALRTFACDVRAHVARRVETGACFFTYDVLGSDVMAYIAELAGHRAASSLMRTQRDFAADERVRALLPRLYVRNVEHFLPHKREYVTGLGTVPVVCKVNLVAVVVDLAVCGIARPGAPATRKHTENRGWDRYHLLSRGERQAQTCEFAQHDRRCFEEEPAGEGRFRARLTCGTFFDGELSCKVELVYADDHSPVDASVSETLKATRTCANEFCLRTYTSRDHVPYPAYCTMHVMRLSSGERMRMFKMKVTAKGMVRAAPGRPSYEQTLVAYSTAFASVATKRPFKRKRQEAR